MLNPPFMSMRNALPWHGTAEWRLENYSSSSPSLGPLSRYLGSSLNHPLSACWTNTMGKSKLFADQSEGIRVLQRTGCGTIWCIFQCQVLPTPTNKQYRSRAIKTRTKELLSVTYVYVRVKKKNKVEKFVIASPTFSLTFDSN